LKRSVDLAGEGSLEDFWTGLCEEKVITFACSFMLCVQIISLYCIVYEPIVVTSTSAPLLSDAVAVSSGLCFSLLMTSAVPLRPSHSVASSSKPFKRRRILDVLPAIGLALTLFNDAVSYYNLNGLGPNG
jgi:hypothetical protein